MDLEENGVIDSFQGIGGRLASIISIITIGPRGRTLASSCLCPEDIASGVYIHGQYSMRWI